MKIASLNTLKKELSSKSGDELMTLCLQLVRYKKENKELLNYLLFEAADEHHYIEKVKEEVSEEFKVVRQRSFFQARKAVRRILKLLKKYIKFSGRKETEIELLIFFCKEFKNTPSRIQQSKTMINVYERQLAGIQKILASLHEDVQLDYQQDMEDLRN